MASRFLTALGRALDADATLRAGEHVLVALSGGPDSTALLAGLVELGPPRGLSISAGHVDHGLRPDSGADGERAVALARTLGVRIEIEAVTVSPGSSVEARARAVRLAALGRLADCVGASRIALAHTADDQAETLLLRLVRGAGRRGLGAMRARRDRFWRPLLATTRADVRRFVTERGLVACVDRTNADLAHARNRLRRLVVPLLEREFNPRLVLALCALATRLGDEDALLHALAVDRLAVHGCTEGLRTSVTGEPPALGRRVIRAWLEAAGVAGVSAATVERALALAGAARRGAIGVRGPGRVVREGDLLVLRPGRRAAEVAFGHPLAPGDTVTGPDGAWQVRCGSIRARRGDDLAGLGPTRARLDAEQVRFPLLVRPPRRGDRVHIAGVGTKKLQDVFVDGRIARERRRLVPVVADQEGRIAWVAGVVRGAVAMLSAATTTVIDLEFE